MRGRWPRAAWGWEAVLGIGLAGWFALQVGMLAMMLALGYEAGKVPVDGRLFFSQLPGQLFWVLAVPLVARFLDREHGWPSLGCGGEPLREFSRGLLWYVPIGITVWTGIVAYRLIWHYFGGESAPDQFAVELAKDDKLAPILVVAIFVQVAGITAFAEEFFFRGLLHGWLRKHLSLWPTALIAGALFGLVHGLEFAVPLGLFGVLLSWLRERIGLLACVAAHLVHNALVLTLVRYASV